MHALPKQGQLKCSAMSNQIFTKTQSQIKRGSKTKGNFQSVFVADCCPPSKILQQSEPLCLSSNGEQRRKMK